MKHSVDPTAADGPIPKSKVETDDFRVKRVEEFMRENLHRRVPLDELANIVNLSIWRLCHLFRSETGVSPIQYLKSLRLERARDLLETSLLSIREIAKSIGLDDQSHFVRDFKKVYGASPTSYRMRFQRALPNGSLQKDPDFTNE